MPYYFPLAFREMQYIFPSISVCIPLHSTPVSYHRFQSMLLVSSHLEEARLLNVGAMYHSSSNAWQLHAIQTPPLHLKPVIASPSLGIYSVSDITSALTQH